MSPSSSHLPSLYLFLPSCLSPPTFLDQARRELRRLKEEARQKHAVAVIWAYWQGLQVPSSPPPQHSTAITESSTSYSPPHDLPHLPQLSLFLSFFHTPPSPSLPTAVVALLCVMELFLNHLLVSIPEVKRRG